MSFTTDFGGAPSGDADADCRTGTGAPPTDAADETDTLGLAPPPDVGLGACAVVVGVSFERSVINKCNKR